MVIENGRKLELQILYEGKDITKYIDKDLLSFTSSDSINEFDTIDLTIQNRELLWINGWAPLKGEKIEAKAILSNWESADHTEIKIGTFYIDDISYSGPPDICSIKALSVDITSNVMDNKRHRVWENVTLEKIARDVAKECNLELIFDVDFKFEYKRAEAKLETYFNFLKRLSKEAGILVKLYNDKLILIEETLYEKKEPPGATRKQKEEYLGKIAEKALKEKNKNSVRGNIKLLGKEQLLSVGNTINILGFGIFDGKYLIAKIDTDFKDYTLSLDIRKIEEEEK